MSKRKVADANIKEQEPENKKKYKYCQTEGCEIVPVFGTEPGKGLYCAAHAQYGMKDVKNKICEHKGCTTRASFGFTLNKPIRCIGHAAAEMRNVLKNFRKCKEIGCTTTATQGLVWRRPTHCAVHALHDMSDVVHKQCEHPGCSLRPTYGTVWHTAVYCSMHAQPGMTNVLTKRCEYVGCDTQPSYGIEWKKPTHCVAHALKGMNDVVNKRCMHPDCSKRPQFGFILNNPLYCSAHLQDGTKNVVSKPCKHPSCEIRPCFGIESGKAEYCVTHALSNMVDVRNPRCKVSTCKGRPRFGNHLTGRAFCAAHRDKAQHWLLVSCKHSGCRRIATHSQTGSYPFTFCDNHTPDGFSSCKEQRCLKCGFEFLCDEEQLCLNTCTAIHQDYVKRTENAMNDFLEKKGLTFVRDGAPAGSCTKRRPDFVFQTEFGVIIVENDENQHKSNLCECEQTRMIALHQAYGEAVHFLRFNPDRFIFSTTGRTGFLELPQRHTELYKLLQKLLKTPQAFFIAHPGLSVRYMYFDNCDTPKHFQQVTDIMY